MNWLTFIVIMVFILCVLTGVRRGMIKSIYSVGVVIVGFLLAAILNPLVSHFLHENNSIYQTVYKAVEENIKIEGKIKTLTQENDVIAELPLPELVRKKLKENNNTEIYQAMAVDNFKQYIYTYITNMILNAISYLALFVLIAVLLRILAEALNIISKLPVIKELDQLAGGVLGLLQAFLLFWIFTGVLAVCSHTAWAQNLYGMINDSEVLSVLYNRNLLVEIITGIKNSFF